jgi:hypothetical protein
MHKTNLHLLLFVAISLLISACEYERVATPPVCELDPITIALDETNSLLEVLCGAENGELIVVGNGGGSTLEYSINKGIFGASNTFNDLGAGTYTIIARDAINLCESNPLIVEVLNQGGLSISLERKDNAACGVASGSISISQTDGVLPIRYQLEQGAEQESNIFDNLTPGSYNIVARDANGCEASIDNITISSGVSLSQDIQLIINTNCAVTGCHNNAQSPNLNTLQSIIDNANRVRSRTSSGTMPPSGRQDLTQTEIDLIACWVEDGALNN